MKVILLESVEGWGTLGDVVNVKDGFARNFLLPLPEGAACQRGEPEGVRRPARRKSKTGNAKAKEVAAKAGDFTRRYGLYPDPSGRAIAATSTARSPVVMSPISSTRRAAKVARSMVSLDKPIKTLGLHEVKIRLHPEVSLTVTLNIARSQGEAERQARGENVIYSQFEKERQAADQTTADLLEGGAGQMIASESADAEA